MGSIYAANPNRTNNIFALPTTGNKGKQSIGLKMGDTISATIMSKTDKKTTLLTKENLELKADSANIKGEVGEEVHFEVVKNDKDGLALKQLLVQSKKQARSDSLHLEMQETKELFKQSNLTKEENTYKQDSLDNRLNETRAIAKIKRQLIYGANNADQNAVRELLKNGISLEKISFDILTTAMTELEKADPKEMTDEEISVAVKAYFDQNAMPADSSEQETVRKTQAAEAIAANNMPVTDKNIELMESALNKLDEILELDDSTIAQLLREDKPLTLENVYVAKYSSKEGSEMPKLSDETKKLLAPEVEKVFSREGIEKTVENLEIADFLLDHDLPVTKENIDKTKALRSLSSQTDQQGQGQDFLNQVARQIKAGRNPGDVYVMENQTTAAVDQKQLMEDYAEIINVLPAIHPDAVDALIRNRTRVTLNGLRLYTSGNKEVQREANQNYSATGQDLSVSTVTAKRQLVEIQLKLTYEAAGRLANKNINIDTMPLEQALEELRIVEQEGYGRNLRTMGAEDSTENIEQLTNLYQKISESNPLTNNVFGNVIGRRVHFSVTGVHESVLAARAAEGYEQFATVPNPKYGDSFANVRDQISGLLEDIGMDVTDANVKAAAILSKNQMDVTPENLLEVKLIDEKINYMFNRLHPCIAANMIKEGLNPADMHVDEVISYIDRFENVYGEDLADSIPKLIMEADENKTLEKDQRDAMIAIYRMLNSIEKSGGVALGVVIKNDADFTLGNMLEASKYYHRTYGKHSDMDVKVDDDFGSLEGLKIPEDNIKNILQYNQMVAREFIDHATPPVLAELMEKYPDYDNLSLEALTAEARNISEASDYQPSDIQMDEYVQQLQDVFNASATTIQWMEANAVPTTPGYIHMVQHFMKDSFFMGKQINGLPKHENTDSQSWEEDILDTELSALKEGREPEAILHAMDEKIQAIKEEQSSREIIKQFQLAQNAIKIQNYAQNLDGNQNIKLPVQLHNKVSSLNMYVMNDNIAGAEETTTLMALDTNELGAVQILISMNGDDVSLQVRSDRPEALDYMRERSQSLIDYAEASGFTVNAIEFGGEMPQTPQMV